MKLKNKIALITGSSRGIGKAIALEFAKEGAKIIVNYVNAEKEAKQVVQDIKKLGSDAIAIKCDVSDEKQVQKMIKEAVTKYGRIDVLVNNAGIVYDIPFKEKTAEQWKKTLEVNLIGPFLCVKYALEHIPKGGRIINISSTNAIDSLAPDSMDYDASKSGVVSLTKNLATELAPNILVNSIAPGWVNTDINKGLSKEFIKEETARILLKRFARPEEIAKLALFLASEDSSFITGTTIKIDGGYS
jgi:3-oxoacyl-[acyl-carrier protein] reductase